MEVRSFALACWHSLSWSSLLLSLSTHRKACMCSGLIKSNKSGLAGDFRILPVAERFKVALRVPSPVHVIVRRKSSRHRCSPVGSCHDTTAGTRFNLRSCSLDGAGSTIDSASRARLVSVGAVDDTSMLRSELGALPKVSMQSVDLTILSGEMTGQGREVQFAGEKGDQWQPKSSIPLPARGK